MNDKDKEYDSNIEYMSIPPDGGWGWFVVFTAFCWSVVVDGTIFTFGLFLEDMKRDFQASGSLLTIASSVQMGIIFFLGPLVAAMINRFGFRVVSMTGGSIAFAGILGTAYVDSVYGYIAIFGCILGIAFSMTYLSSILVVGFYFSKNRAIATCLSVTGTAVGVSMSPIICSILLAETHWRDKYKYISGAHLAMTLMGLVYKPIKPSQIVVEGVDRTRLGETSSLWEMLEKKSERSYRDFPTAADAFLNQEYNVLSPYDASGRDSKASFHSSRTRASKTGGIRSSLSTMRSLRVSIQIPTESFLLRRKCCCFTCKCRYRLCPCLWHDRRPMYRDDILYQGSTRSLALFDKAQFKHDRDAAKLKYHMSVTRTAAITDTPQNADCCNCCPASVTRVLGQMLDVSLLRSSAFMLLCFSGFLTYMGIYVPYVYAIELSVQCGIPRDEATYVLTAIGASNGVGRFLSGMLTLIPRANAMVITEVTMFIAGIAMVVHPFFCNYTVHMLCACLFGFNAATVASLRTIVVVDLMGLEKLTNAFGLIMVAMGMSALVALPISALLFEIQNNFILPFVFGGSMVALSGLVLIPVKPMYQRALKRAERKRQLAKEKKYKGAYRRGANQAGAGTSRRVDR